MAAHNVRNVEIMSDDLRAECGIVAYGDVDVRTGTGRKRECTFTLAEDGNLVVLDAHKGTVVGTGTLVLTTDLREALTLAVTV